MTLPPPSVCRRIRKLHAMLGASDKERDLAFKKLAEILKEHRLSWNDLPEILTEQQTSSAAAPPPPPAGETSTSAPTDGSEVNVLDLVERLIELHIALTPEQRLAVALWVLHTYVFGRFQITPRLALLSPVRGCGKTTLLALLEQLTADPYRSDHVTAAAIYHELAGRERSLLIDEGDNLGLHRDNVVRAIFNAGHRRGGAISRFVSGRSRKFPVFSPLAIAAIGALPLPIMHRAIIIQMQRRPRDVPLQQFNPHSPDNVLSFGVTCAIQI